MAKAAPKAVAKAVAKKGLTVSHITSIGRGARVKNKHKRRMSKPYKGQGR